MSAPWLYARLLGDQWERLGPRVHLQLSAPSYAGSGAFTVRHGRGAPARWLTRLMGAPAEGDGLATRLSIRRTPEREEWDRTVGGRGFCSTQVEHDGHLVERFGPFEFHFRLEACAGELRFHQIGCALRVGPLVLRLPRLVSPRVTATLGEAGVAVRVAAALVGPLFSYEGRVDP